MPLSVAAIHLAFLAGVVMLAHHPVLFMGLFMLFLGFTSAYPHYQNPLIIKEGLLVGFFLAGLVVLGGMQQWWLQPIVESLSPLALFLQADIVVKLVMIGLLLASIWTWGIIIGFMIKLGGVRRRGERFERDFLKAEDIDAFHRIEGESKLPVARVFSAGVAEWRRSTTGASIDREGTRLDRPYELNLWEPTDDPRRASSVQVPLDPTGYQFDPLMLI